MSILFQMDFGALKTEKKKTGIEVMTELRRINLPPGSTLVCFVSSRCCVVGG
jgi:hypothetical protein